MVSLITLPSSFLEYSAFIASANALRLGTSTIRKDEEQLYQHTLHRKFGEANCHYFKDSDSCVFSVKENTYS
jgi:hypothetical protein